MCQLRAMSRRLENPVWQGAGFFSGAVSLNGRLLIQLGMDKTRVALYLRVSTTDKGQDVENQRAQLLAFCERQGYEVVREYVDEESGTKGRRERSAFAQLFRDAALRRFDLLLFWALDRFSREGIRNTMHYLQQLDASGVRFRSYTEPYLETENELVGTILLTVLSHFAKLEATKVSERTKAGLERARKQGKRLGQPSKRERWRPTLVRLQEEGISLRGMARETGLSINSVKKYLADL